MGEGVQATVVPLSQDSIKMKDTKTQDMQHNTKRAFTIIMKQTKLNKTNLLPLHKEEADSIIS